MLLATIKACPVFGGKVKSYDAAKAEKMPGVKKVVQVADNAVAVVADTFWHAKMALEAVTIDWDTAGNEKHNSATIAEFLKAGLDADKAIVGNENGDIKAAIAGAARRRSRPIYNYPYQNHACMEPMNATALYTDDKCEVWYRDAGWRRRRSRAVVADLRPGGRQVRRAQGDARRRLRPARPGRTT